MGPTRGWSQFGVWADLEPGRFVGWADPDSGWFVGWAGFG